MNQKYSGKFSPDNKESQAIASARQSLKMRKALRRLRTYRILSGVLAIGGLISLLGGDPIGALFAIGVSITAVTATQLMEAGLNAEAAYDARTIARAPAWPRKTIAAGLMGVAAAAGSHFVAGADFIVAGAFGIVATVGMLMAYGTDPIRAKGMRGVDQAAASRVADAIERAEALIAEIRNYASGFSDRRLRLDVETLALSADEMFRALEDDPSDLRNARKYLGVYLTAARDATAQFAALPVDASHAEAATKYKSLISELDTGFRQKRSLMLEDNRNSLDIEIDVLRERLAAEGIKISSPQ